MSNVSVERTHPLTPVSQSAKRAPDATPEMIHASVGISNTDNIKVAVRVRPLNSKEIAANVSECVTVAEVRGRCLEATVGRCT
jgi:hypothetical protein